MCLYFAVPCFKMYIQVISQDFKMKQGLYEHYKGKHYQVIGICRHSETLEDMVVYRALYGDGSLWVRPKHMFEEEIVYEGLCRPRFQFIRAIDIA